MATTPGTNTDRKDLAARDRLLLAATQLLDEAAGGAGLDPGDHRAGGSTRTDALPPLRQQAGVAGRGRQPRLQGVPEEPPRRAATQSDPLEDIRAGWDSHVAFGLEFPGAYAHIYGNVKPGVPCGVTEDVRAHLLEALQPAAIQGRLRVSPAEAATRILAACSGVTLTLIQQPPAERDLGLSERMRESVLASISDVADGDVGSECPSRAAGARVGCGGDRRGRQPAHDRRADADARTPCAACG